MDWDEKVDLSLFAVIFPCDLRESVGSERPAELAVIVESSFLFKATAYQKKLTPPLPIFSKFL